MKWTLKYTPGPWKWLKDSDHRLWVLSIRRKPIAEVFDVANMRLAALAPEMWEILKHTKEFHEYAHDNCGCETCKFVRRMEEGE